MPIGEIRTKLRVGPAGIPSINLATFREWIDFCQTKEFTALELEFVRITISEYPSPEELQSLAEYAETRGVKLSIHGAFYINLAATTKNKIAIAQEYLRQGISLAEAVSGNLIFHPGYFQKLAHTNAIHRAIKLF